MGVDWFSYTIPIIHVIYVCLGVPGVQPERFKEGMQVKHCALSLVGLYLTFGLLDSVSSTRVTFFNFSTYALFNYFHFRSLFLE